MNWLVMDLQGRVLAQFDDEENAHAFADKQVNFAYVVDAEEYYN